MSHLLFDVSALAEHLLHDNFVGFRQETLAFTVVSKRLILVMEIGRFLYQPICYQ